MIILGIDPGSRKTGYGLIRKLGNRTIHIENGTLYCEDKGGLSLRLVYLFEALQAVIRKHSPVAMAVENIFFHKNPKSLQKLGEVRGVLMLSGAVLGLPVYEYTALEVKKAVTGYGGASKAQMQGMVRTLLNLRDLAEENATDALGVALCHAHSVDNLARARFHLKGTPRLAMKELLKRASFYR